MKLQSDEEMIEEFIFKPCKKCGATDYDNCDSSEESFDEDLKSGKFILEPKSCDKCDLEWMLSESNLLH